MRVWCKKKKTKIKLFIQGQRLIYVRSPRIYYSNDDIPGTHSIRIIIWSIYNNNAKKIEIGFVLPQSQVWNIVLELHIPCVSFVLFSYAIFQDFMHTEFCIRSTIQYSFCNKKPVRRFDNSLKKTPKPCIIVNTCTLL